MYYRLVVIGGGPAGCAAAVRAARRGATVALVARNGPGGATGGPGSVAAAVPGRIAVYPGTGRLWDPGRVEVVRPEGYTEELVAGNVVVATGAGSPEDRRGTLHRWTYGPRRAAGKRDLPGSALVLGGGITACELAAGLAAAGVSVTLLAEGELLPGVDRDAAEVVGRTLRRRGITVRSQTQVQEVREGTGKVTVVTSDGTELTADRLLEAPPRKVRCDHLGLESLGVEPDERGAVPVDERMQTAIPGVYAAGDVTGPKDRPALARAEGIVAAENALGRPCRLEPELVPYHIRVGPGAAGVGAREHELAARGVPYRVVRLALLPWGAGQRRGFLKLVSCPATDRLYGVHAVGPKAGAWSEAAALALRTGLTSREFLRYAGAARPEILACQ
jgi:dihydrolipoamide dehydrogenase